MKKNGFIATSVLYTFFLVFLTLFVALIANYMHNRILLAKIEDTSREMLAKINNLKLNDLKIGDHIKFKCNENLLDSNATWIVAKIEESATDKTYFFISDLTASRPHIRYKLPGEPIDFYRPASIDFYLKLKSISETDGGDPYKKAISRGGFDVQLVTSSFLSEIRGTEGYDSFVLAEIFNPGGSYTVHIDKDMPTGDGLAKYDTKEYYELKRYNFTNDDQNNLIPNYCGGKYESNEVKYNANNSFGYMNVDNHPVKKDTKYISYCYYASPDHYIHTHEEQIIGYDESKESDKVILKTSTNYALRFMAERTIKNNEANMYIAGGKGTSIDPYIFTDGVKQS